MKSAENSVWALTTTTNSARIDMYIAVFETEKDGIEFLNSFGFDVKWDGELHYVESNVNELVEKGLMTSYVVRDGFEVILELQKIGFSVQLVKSHNE